MADAAVGIRALVSLVSLPISLVRRLAYATKVASLMARLAVVLLALVSTAGSLRLCDGWKAMPEARMECCAKGAACPMRERLANGHHHAHVTQSAADTCCAVSSRDGAAASATYALPSLAFASPGLAALESGLAPARHAHVRVTESPPPDDVPRHLRLSVFLL